MVAFCTLCEQCCDVRRFYVIALRSLKIKELTIKRPSIYVARQSVEEAKRHMSDLTLAQLCCCRFSSSGMLHFIGGFAYQALQSVVDLGFQYSLPPFRTVSCRCISVFYSSYIKSFPTLFLHILRGFPLFLVPNIVAVAICFVIVWFCVLPT